MVVEEEMAEEEVVKMVEVARVGETLDPYENHQKSDVQMIYI